MTAIEVLGFLTGAISVWLAVRENVWSWPVGLANSAIFLILFWSAALYANSALQILYITLGIFGWWNWIRGGAGLGPLKVQRTPRPEAIWLLIFTLVAFAVLTTVLDRFTDSDVPSWDGLTVALSLSATYMLTRKFIENWLVWIVADVIYVPLYASQRLYLTSVVYAIFLAMCIAGYVKWRRAVTLAHVTA